MSADHSPLNSHSKPPRAKPSCRPPPHRVKPQAGAPGQGRRSRSHRPVRARTGPCGVRDCPGRRGGRYRGRRSGRSAPARRRAAELPHGALLRCGLDGCHLDHGAHRRAPAQDRLHAEHHRSLGTGHVRIPEEQGHRCVPRQLDAGPGRRSGAVRRRRLDHGRRTEPLRGEIHLRGARPTSTPRGSRTSATSTASPTPLNHSIYGIEPGNDGNRLVLKMLKDNQYGLGDFKLIESSEQGMLAQVERAYRNKQPIVFLAWEPHPMNMRFDIKYLAGGDAVFGANYRRGDRLHRDAQGLRRASARTSAACSIISSSRCAARAK